MGPMHVVMLSSEHHSQSDPWRCRGCTERQVAFLEEDLREAAKPENRKLRPWIVVVIHRPFYNAGRNGIWCAPRPALLATPASLSAPPDADRALALRCRHLQKKEFEPIMERYRVNLVLQGHCHNYERTYPVYDVSCPSACAAARTTTPQRLHAHALAGGQH